ncbi:hypothetical protein ACFELO_02130 [Oceanicaulis sp. LC35]|uniref:hypothetical protein n=1 Tax=Oceanicaulis sp. LC35 TaxID=3349635 RepID=UPI003F833993
MMTPALLSLAPALLMVAAPVALAEDTPSPAGQVYDIDFLHGQAPRHHTYQCELTIAEDGEDMSFGEADAHMPIMYDYQAECSTSGFNGERQSFSGQLAIRPGHSVRFEGGDPYPPFLTEETDCQGWPDTPLGEVDAPPCWVKPGVADIRFHMLRRK